MSGKIKLTKTLVFFVCIGAILVFWLGLLLAPAVTYEGNLFDKVSIAQIAFDTPLNIEFSESNIKVALVFLLFYAMALLVAYTSQRNYRKGEEHGSAKWGDVKTLNNELLPNKSEKGIVLTQNVSLSIKDTRTHDLNLNVIVNGGPGSGKSIRYVIPNLLQANCSYVVLDPKGETLYRTGTYLEKQGYKIKVLDLKNMNKSHGYNPFKYIPKDDLENGVQILVTNIFQAQSAKEAKTQDPFWEDTGAMLLKALMLFLCYEAPPYEQNLAMVLELIRYASVREDDESYQSPVDILFEQLRNKDPKNLAVYYYDLYKSGAGKTLKSIQITLISKIEKFLVPPLERLTACDELEIDKMGEELTALFLVIPDDDTSYNFLISILYMQIFQTLKIVSDEKYESERLPVQVHMIMDEFANVALPEKFEEILATIRSRGINVSIIIQAISQLKRLFEKNWETIMSCCSSFLYLGGSEQSTHKYISEMLGKETIDTNTYGYNKGRGGSYTTNYQNSGRDLLDPAEVRLLDKSDAILIVQGKRIVKDKKFDTFNHPNIYETTFKGGKPYKHGEVKNVATSIQTTYTNERDNIPDVIKNIDLSQYEILDDEI